ncbi:uncharacterized protein LOC117175311 [Belonocnema kinseyi]|uniref:uncharacterized protein LOC117175311 n=1 Tax=Belonocnema kinseyi TaxID=2817044 RepID=UPI00143D7596|nr:uncharacterized protein LOC117175311 [Belonocnema kinseyi]
MDGPLSSAIKELKGVLKYLESYRSDDGFASTITDAKELAEILGVDSDFKSAQNVRPRRQKRQFDYESEDQAVQDPKTRLKVGFFFQTLDVTISSIKERFDQLQAHNSHFSFLYDISALKHMPLTVLLDNCTKLETFLTHQDLKDIDAQQLSDELQVLSHSIDETVSLTPLNVLQHVVEIGIDCYSNFAIALRILLTLPITVASGKRSFSKLKLIKTYLRSTMSEMRLMDLTIISIE